MCSSPEILDDLKLFADLGIELSNDSQAYLFGDFVRREVKAGFYYRNPHTRGGVNDNDEALMPQGSNYY